MASNDIDRREFFRLAAAGAAASAAVLSSCGREGGRSSAGAVPEGKEGMTYRTSSSGDKVSLLGYGCMRWPKAAQPAEDGNVIDQDAVNTLVDYAIEHGVNYFDTSPVYMQGFSERSTGIALKRHPRESYYIASKLSNFQNWTRDNSILMYERSFRELQTDYIDYYLMHSVGNGGKEMFEQRYIDNGMADFLVEERKKGRIRHLGFSFHGTKEVFDYVLSLHDRIHWDFVQIQLNYVDWTHASGNNVNADYLYSELEKRGIQAIIMEPLLGGRLSKVPDHIAERLLERRPGDSVASWAFRFAGSRPGVLTVLSGMTYMSHLQDNVRTFSPLVPLTDDDYAFLEETADLMMAYPTIPCNDCKYCMPCPFGIDIPAMLLHYNKCVNEGYLVDDPQEDSYARARRAYLIGYDRAVPDFRQADHCVGCGRCAPHCPQSIDIPAELRKIDRFVEKLRRSRNI